MTDNDCVDTSEQPRPSTSTAQPAESTTVTDTDSNQLGSEQPPPPKRSKTRNNGMSMIFYMHTTWINQPMSDDPQAQIDADWMYKDVNVIDISDDEDQGTKGKNNKLKATLDIEEFFPVYHRAEKGGKKGR